MVGPRIDKDHASQSSIWRIPFDLDSESSGRVKRLRQVRRGGRRALRLNTKRNCITTSCVMYAWVKGTLASILETAAFSSTPRRAIASMDGRVGVATFRDSGQHFVRSFESLDIQDSPRVLDSLDRLAILSLTSVSDRRRRGLRSWSATDRPPLSRVTNRAERSVCSLSFRAQVGASWSRASRSGGGSSGTGP